MKLKSYLLSLLVLFACSLVVTSCEEDPIDKFGDVTVDGHTLAFDLRVGGQTAKAVNVEVLPSNNESTYYFGIIPSEEVGDTAGDELVKMLLDKNANSQLISGRHYVTSEAMENEAPLQPATAYIAYALGYDAGTQTVTSDLTMKPFKTKKGEAAAVTAPEVEFIGVTDEKGGVYGFAARCTSKDASEAYIGVLPVGAYDQLKGQGVTLETLFDNIEGYITFSEQNGWLDRLNTEDGIALNAGKIDGKGREGVLKVFNTDKAVTVAWTNTSGEKDSWSSASTTPNPDNGGVSAPEVQFQGGIDDAQGVYAFVAKCVSGDATGAMIGLLEGGAYETLKGQGGSLANVFDMLQGATDFASQQGWLEALNSADGLGLNAGKVEAGTVLEAFLKVTNDEGGITVKWADTKGQSDSWNNGGQGGGDTPAGNNPTVEFLAGVHDGVVTFAMACTSQDATTAFLIIAEKAEVDEMNASLEDIMNENIKGALEFKPEWMAKFNSKDGMSLTNKSLDPKGVWTGILDTRNEGGRLVKRADTDSGAIKSTRMFVRSAKVAFKPAYVSSAVALR